MKESEGRRNSKNKCIEHKGLYYYRNKDGYYACRRPNSLLHRVVWEEENGPIPKGFVIHHIDHDTDNNHISNLECLSWKEHASYHAKESGYFGSEENIEHLNKIRKMVWKKKEKSPSVCTHCGKDYLTLQPERSIFCSRSCKSIVHGRKFRERQKLDIS